MIALIVFTAQRILLLLTVFYSVFEVVLLVINNDTAVFRLSLDNEQF